MKGNVLRKRNSIRPSEKERLSVRVRKKGEVTSLVTVFNLKDWLSDRQCCYLLLVRKRGLSVFNSCFKILKDAFLFSFEV